MIVRAPVSGYCFAMQRCQFSSISPSWRYSVRLELWMRSLFPLLVAFLAWSSLPLSAQPPNGYVEGVVLDSSNSVVAGAQVTLNSGDVHQQQKTDNEGHFHFQKPALSRATIHVEAAGFATQDREWQYDDPPLRIVLTPAADPQQITVTATRASALVGDTAADVLQLSTPDVSTAGAVTLDQTLRQVPGFSLFRRTGSLGANPTSQGVSLRGLGASGASRSLVLYDGIPLNDPFGGWVYWDRVPTVAIQDVEVLRGGASDLYGTGALAGVVNVLPRREAESDLSAEVYMGNHVTPDGSVFGNLRLGKTTLSASGEAFSTDGYLQVRPQDRGSVDTPVNDSHRTGSIGIDHELRNQGRVFLNGSLFREERNNGTVLQVNNTRAGQVAAGTDLISKSAGTFNIRLFGEGQRYYQTFSSIALDRNSESLTRTQIVPAQRLGFSAAWNRAVRSHTLVAGVEGQDIRGNSNELGYSSGVATVHQDNGGRQRLAGVYGEDIIRIGPNWVVTAAARFDHWSNIDAFSNSTVLATGKFTPTLLPDRDESAFSPRVSVLRRVNQKLSLAASVYRAFRAPTLNELYRSYRVGNTMTLANDMLVAERLTGGEASAILHSSERLSLRGTFFWEQVARPVANVTLTSTPALITQQRENLGSIRSRGIELQSESRLRGSFFLSAGYLYTDAGVIDFPANPLLVGLWVPQVPHQQVTFGGRYSNPRHFTLALQGRYIGTQFEDDENTLSLDPFFTMDAFFSREVNRFVELFAAAENLTGQRYQVGRTPTLTIGPPILARAGVRFNLRGR